MDEHLTAIGVHKAYPLMKYSQLTSADRAYLQTNLDYNGYFYVNGENVTILTLLQDLNEPYKPEDLMMITADRRGQARFSIDPQAIQPSALFTLDYARFLRYTDRNGVAPGRVDINLSSNDLRYYLATDGAIKYMDITANPTDLAPLLK